MILDTGLDGIAAAAAGYEPSTRQRDAARLRVADALFSYQLGRTLPVAPVVSSLVGPVPACRPTGVAFELAACIRYTEIDDLLLSSCVSPGAIVIPAVVAVASMDGARSIDDLLDAAVVGYGIAGWLGELCGGALAVTRGVWPSRAVAPVTAALCAGRALGLDRRGLADAATLASVWRATGRLAEPARELTFARAVSTGVEAAQAVAHGVQARGVVGSDWVFTDEGAGAPGSPVLALDRAVLDARVKLFCAARQVMPAILALHQALESAGVTDPGALDAIELELPEACAEMVDVPQVQTRLDSLRSAQYQVAALLLGPDELWDVRRSELRFALHAEALAASISVRSAIDLAAKFPASWPARATVRVEGRETTALAPDDPSERLDATGLRAKQRAFCGPDEASGALAAAVLEACGTSKSAGDLWSLACFIAEATRSDETNGRRTNPMAV